MRTEIDGAAFEPTIGGAGVVAHPAMSRRLDSSDAAVHLALGSRSRRALSALILVGTGFIAGVIMLGVGMSPSVLVVAVLTLATLRLHQWGFAWPSAVSASVLLALLAHIGFARLSPILGIPLGTPGELLLILAGTILLGDLIRIFVQRGDVRLPGARTWRWPVAGLAMPIVVAGIVSLGYRLGVLPVAWAMNNDVAWNTMAARFILLDGGIAPSRHPNPSPLVNELVASWISPGRAAAIEVLRHDVTRQAEFWLALILLSAVLGALVMVRSVPPGRPVLRWAAAAVGAALPLSWYAMGFAVRFGFLNATLALVVLLAVWIVATDVRIDPLISTALLFVATSVALSAWAPLAAIPLALAALTGTRAVPNLFHRRNRWLLVALTAAMVQVPLYLLFVTLPDVRRDGAALAADGGFPPIVPRDVVLTAVFALLVCSVSAVVLRSAWPVVSLAVLVAAAAFAVGYLLLQRADLPSWWGYYPAKLAWIVCTLLVIISAAEAVRIAARARRRWLLAGILVAGGLMVALPLAWSAPQEKDVRSLIPIAALFDGRSDSAADMLFAVADSPGKSIVGRSGATTAADATANFWLLQLHSDRSADPIRAFAYEGTFDDVDRVCAAAQTWGGGVALLTRDAGFAAQVGSTCADAVLPQIMSEAPRAVADPARVPGQDEAVIFSSSSRMR